MLCCRTMCVCVCRRRHLYGGPALPADGLWLCGVWVYKFLPVCFTDPYRAGEVRCPWGLLSQQQQRGCPEADPHLCVSLSLWG